MPRNSLNPNTLPLIAGDRDAIADAPPQPRKTKAARQRKRRRQASEPLPISTEYRPPRPVPMSRIRNLIAAAVRVWELKHGIHEPRYFDFNRRELLQGVIDDF
jgi:hypothetical protein